MNVVLDTNILVSSQITQKGNPALIVQRVLEGELTACYSHTILHEYAVVLSRSQFHLSEKNNNSLLDGITRMGILVSNWKKSDIIFIDETDRKFYEVAKQTHAVLITGNLKHYPDDPCVMTPAQFLADY